MRLLAILPLENGMKYLGVLFIVLAVSIWSHSAGHAAVFTEESRICRRVYQDESGGLELQERSWSRRRGVWRRLLDTGSERNVIVEWDAKKAAVSVAAVSATLGLSKEKREDV